MGVVWVSDASRPCEWISATLANKTFIRFFGIDRGVLFVKDELRGKMLKRGEIYEGGVKICMH